MSDKNLSILVQYRFQRAMDTIPEIELLLANKFWNTAVNRMYYASFYAVGALLIKHNLLATTHSGTKQLLGQHFVNKGIVSKASGRHFTRLFEKRQKGDYDDYFDNDEQSTTELWEPTKAFIEEIRILLDSRSFHL